MENKFDRSKHVFYSDAFAEIIKDTIRFFNGTPVHHLPPPRTSLGQVCTLCIIPALIHFINIFMK